MQAGRCVLPPRLRCTCLGLSVTSSSSAALFGKPPQLFQEQQPKKKEQGEENHTSPVSLPPCWRFISASISGLSVSALTSPMQPRSLARLLHVLPPSALKTCAQHVRGPRARTASLRQPSNRCPCCHLLAIPQRAGASAHATAPETARRRPLPPQAVPASNNEDPASACTPMPPADVADTPSSHTARISVPVGTP